MENVTPLDLIKIRREDPELFFSKYFGNNLNHKPMKKYRVVTNNLDYNNILRFDIIRVGELGFTKLNSSVQLTILNEPCFNIHTILRLHPEWFEEIKEYEVTGNKNVSFSEEDMIEFGKYVKNREKFAYLDMPTKYLLTLFMKRKGTSPMTKDELIDAKTKANGGKFYDLIKDLGSNKYAGKQYFYTLKDMIEFGRFVYGQTKPSTIPIDMTLLDKWIQKAHPEDCVTKTKDSQKEEPKEYTEFDMRESFNAGINRGNYLTEEGILSMKGKFPPFEYWLKSYKK